MFRYKIIFLVFLFILVSSIFLNGCGKVKNNDEINNYKLEINEDDFNVTDEEIYSSIPNLKHFINFLNMIDYIDDKHNKEIKELTSKFNSERNFEVKIEYARELIDLYNNYITDFNYFVDRGVKIYNISFLDDVIYYKSKALIEMTSYLMYLINLEDIEKLRDTNDSAIIAYNNYKKEIRKLEEYFNNKANELGFKQPFELN